MAAPCLVYDTWPDLAMHTTAHFTVLSKDDIAYYSDEMMKVLGYKLSLFPKKYSKITTKTFHTDVFSFKKGVTQGDPMSAIIFMLAFQPIIDHLMKNDKFGVLINGQRVITLPYADDFCLITTDMRSHKRLIAEIHSHINSMGMSLKPVKC